MFVALWRLDRLLGHPLCAVDPEQEFPDPFGQLGGLAALGEAVGESAFLIDEMTTFEIGRASSRSVISRFVSDDVTGHGGI